ncbi:MAG: DegV family protein [Clostridia bacterium]|nr:DegV family protein [Clostridia bacterium]
MKDYKIITDVTCDLSKELYEEMGVEVIPMELTVDEKDTYLHDPSYSELSFEDFYGRLRTGSMAKTAQVTYDGACRVFEKYLSEGTDVLYLAFSSGLSGTYSTASIAASDLAAKYPDSKIYVVDTLAASAGEGMTVWMAARKKADGMGIDELREWVEDYKLHQAHWFTVLDLNFLKRGGRVSPATALVGTALGIKPVLHCDDDGHLINMAKAVGRKKSIIALADKIGESGKEDENETVFIGHGDCYDDAKFLADNILSRYPFVKNVRIERIGPVIGAHSGPGTLALFFVADRR